MNAIFRVQADHPAARWTTGAVAVEHPATTGSVARLDLAPRARLVLPADADAVSLALPLEGQAEIEIDGKPCRLHGRQGLLNARTAAIVSQWPEGGQLLLVTLDRHLLQAQASALFGGARCLARSGFLLRTERDLPAALDENHATALTERLIDMLVAQHGLSRAFRASRSIGLARSLLDEDPARISDLADLARRAGVTPVTLQRGFRQYIGCTIAGYAQRVRLSAARDSLESGRDSRPVATIAHAAGFASTAAFTRAYHKLIGETPTQTRANAVQMIDKIVMSQS